MIFEPRRCGRTRALLALAVARHHAQGVREQVAQGGLVLWLSTPMKHQRARARHSGICGAKLVHVHSIEREWIRTGRSNSILFSSRSQTGLSVELGVAVHGAGAKFRRYAPKRARGVIGQGCSGG